MGISPKTRRFLDHSVNVAIVVVTILVLRNLIWLRWQHKPELDRPTVGNTVSLPGIKWDDAMTLVLALQKGCRYCEESAAFYRSIRNQRIGSQPRILAVLPGDKNEIAGYLSERGISVDGIVSVPLANVNVSVTPTVFLVDRTGKIVDVWVGKIGEHDESEVARRILASR